VLALACATCAPADVVHHTNGDQDIARLSVLQSVDFGSAKGWAGGPVTPSPPKPISCPADHAKPVTLVQTGSAESFFSRDGLQFDSQAQVLRTARMVDLDWQRAVASAVVQPCLAKAFTSHLEHGETFVSFGRTSFPKVGGLTTAYRGVIDVKTGGRKVRLAIDIVLFTSGRVTLDLTTTMELASAASVRPAEVTLARDMAGRAASALGAA
jgi:hypothetical protein